MLKCVIESLEGLSETEAAHYVKKGEKFELQLEGAKTQGDLDRVQKALNDERLITKDLKAQLVPWEGLEADEVKATLAKVPELQTLAEAGGKKLDQAQVDSLVTGRVNAAIAPLKTELETTKASLTAAMTENGAFKQEKVRATMHDAMRKLASESKANSDAFAGPSSGLMLLADAICEIDAAGEVVIRQGAQISDVEHGTRLKDALPALQKHHGYYWPGSQGGGAPGSTGTGGGGGAKNVFKDNNMTARSQLMRENPQEAERQYKASGLTDYSEMYVARK